MATIKLTSQQKGEVAELAFKVVLAATRPYQLGQVNEYEKSITALNDYVEQVMNEAVEKAKTVNV